MHNKQKIAIAQHHFPVSYWVIFALLGMLAGCGQKGDLILPSPPSAQSTHFISSAK
jgi:hypothetical protein